ASLARARIASSFVKEILGKPTSFAAMPRLAITPCKSRSIAVGDAALALDPLSGNGIGSGLRSAILASPVLEAAGKGEKLNALLDHYTWRLRDAMHAHVRNCVQSYSRSIHASYWHREIDAMNKALRRVRSPSNRPSFVLNYGRLDRVRDVVAT